jgi:two-component system, cell cycle response regulator DivK
MNDNPIILYVEDDPLSREVMEIILRDGMGIHQFTILPDSKDFLDKLKQLQPKPTVILLDIHIQPHSGFEMLKMVRADEAFKDITTVAFTASVMSQEVQELKNAGFNGAIAKPVDFDTFPQLLTRILNGEKVWRIDI